MRQEPPVGPPGVTLGQTGKEDEKFYFKEIQIKEKKYTAVAKEIRKYRKMFTFTSDVFHGRLQNIK